MLNCCCAGSCADMSQACGECANPEDVYVLSVFSRGYFTFEMLVDGVSIGFVYPKDDKDPSSCQASYFVSDESVIQEISNGTCFINRAIDPNCLPYPNFQTVDKNIFRKEILNITIRPIPSEIKWNHNGMIFYLYRMTRANDGSIGRVCTIYAVDRQYQHSSTYYYNKGDLSINLRQNMCPPVPCRPCSLVKDSYMMSVVVNAYAPSGGGVIGFPYSPYDFYGELGTFEFFVDGVSIFSETFFGSHQHTHLISDDQRLLLAMGQEIPSCFHVTGCIPMPWLNGSHTFDIYHKLVGKDFFLKDVLNVSFEFASKHPLNNLLVRIDIYRLDEENKEIIRPNERYCNFLQCSSWLCFIGATRRTNNTDGMENTPYAIQPYPRRENLFPIDMKLCPRTPTTPPVLP